MKYRIAIQILSFNKPIYLKQTLDSLYSKISKDDKICILEQTEDSNLKQECLNICKLYPNIHIISLDKNLGQRGATNAVYNSGFFNDSKYIMLCDHDNIYHVDLTVYCDILDKYPDVWVSSGYGSPEHDIENKIDDIIFKSSARAGHMVLRSPDFLSMMPCDLEAGKNLNCAYFCGLDWWITHWSSKSPGHKRSQIIGCYYSGVEHIGRESTWQSYYNDEYSLDDLNWIRNANLYDIIKKYPPRHTYITDKYWYEKLTDDEFRQKLNLAVIHKLEDNRISNILLKTLKIKELTQINTTVIESRLSNIDNLDSITYDYSINPQVLNNVIEYRFNIFNKDIIVFDYALSQSPKSIANEIKNDIYNILDIKFVPGDIVIDLGANIGIFSILLAKLYPFITIICFEPLESNFNNLIKGLEVNNIFNIIPNNLAITKNGRDVISIASINFSGGAMILETNSINIKVKPQHFIINPIKSISVDEIFNKFNISKCKLLKMDIEGFEHEVIPNIKSFDKIEYFSGEFHYTDSNNLNIPVLNKTIKFEKENESKPNSITDILNTLNAVISGVPYDITEDIKLLTEKIKSKIVAFNYIWPEYGIAFLERSIQNILPHVFEYHLFLNKYSYLDVETDIKNINLVKDICSRNRNLGKIILHYNENFSEKGPKIDNIKFYFSRIINLVNSYADYVWLVQSDEIYNSFDVEDVLELCDSNKIKACAITNPICYFDNPHWFVNPPENFNRPSIINVKNPVFNSCINTNISFHHLSYVLTKQELKVKFENWGHRNDIKENLDRFNNSFDLIKTNKDIKDIHPINPSIYKSVGFTNASKINTNLFLDWVNYLINNNKYDDISNFFINYENYKVSLLHRQFFSILVSEMIPANSVFVDIGVNFGADLLLSKKLSPKLRFIGFDENILSYNSAYLSLMKFDLLKNTNLFYGTSKFLVPKFRNNFIDCAFINDVVDPIVLNSTIIEIWPKMKHGSLIVGIYDPSNAQIVNIIHKLISDANYISCPWGTELIRFYEIYINLFNESSQSAIFFARVRKY
jgi:FkbM family methyltransferase